MRSPLPLLSLLLLFISPLPSAAETGDLIAFEALPSGLGSPSGLAFDGSGIWLAELQSAGEPTSENKLLHFDADGDVDAIVQGGPARVLQKLAWDGDWLWATRMYSELHRLGSQGQTVEDFDVPFTQGLAGDPSAARVFLLEGMSSTAIHVVEQGLVVSTINTESAHSYWWGLAYDGCSLWTMDIDTDELLRIDVSTGTLIESVAAPTTRIAALDFNGTALLATDTATDLLLRVEVGTAFLPSGEVCVPGFTEPVTPPVEEDPPADDPPADDPPADDPPADDPTAPDPPADPADGTPPTDDPVAEEPVAEEPVAEEPVAEEPVAEEPGDVFAADNSLGELPTSSPFDNPEPVSARGGCACVRPGGTWGSGGAAFALACLLLLRRRRRTPA